MGRDLRTPETAPTGEHFDEAPEHLAAAAYESLEPLLD